MARRLPWVQEPTPKSRDPDPRASLPPHREATPRRGPSRPSSARRLKHGLRSTARTPSTSPPPERPQEEFMIPGALCDDKYRMVEDEFLAVAQRFTAPLHRAEYERLKELARRRSVAAMGEIIKRPVVRGLSPTAAARRRTESAQRLARQRDALGGSETETGEEEETAAAAGGGLHGLMSAPSRAGRDILPASRRTRAAAGLASSLSRQQQVVEGTEGGAGELQRKRRSRDLVGETAGRVPRERSTAGPSGREVEHARRRKRRRVSLLSDTDEDSQDLDGSGVDESGVNAKRLAGETSPSREPVKGPQRKTQVDLDIIPTFV